MDHTPTTPAAEGDDRPFKILERTPVPQDHKDRLFELVRVAQSAAAAAGKELQGEFGRDAVALIVGCNQFVRLYRGGDHPGRVEVRVPADEQAKLAAAGFELQEPQGAVFKMFGWKAVDPMSGDGDALADAVRVSFRQASA